MYVVGQERQIGGQEKERFMGLVDDRKFYNKNFERLGLSVALVLQAEN